MSTRIETVNNPKVDVLTVGELDENVSYEHAEYESDDRVLTLSYDEVVVISGDLKDFARNVWRAVFEQEPPSA